MTRATPRDRAAEKGPAIATVITADLATATVIAADLATATVIAADLATAAV
jgi:hypothetical protein